MATPTGVLPAGGIPKNLKNILDMLVVNNDLRSWQVYSEPTGVTLKIRFDEAKNGGQATQSTKVSYIKKPPAQVRRDIKRNNNFERRQTRSQTKFEVEDIEQGRFEGDFISSVNEANISHVSLDTESCHSPEIEPLSTSHMSDQPLSLDGSISGSLASHAEHVNRPVQSTSSVEQTTFGASNVIKESETNEEVHTRHSRDLMPFGNNDYVKCGGCNCNENRTVLKAGIRVCTDTSHDEEVFICNPCFFIDKFHAEHTSQIQVYEFPLGPMSRIHCDACGLISQDGSGLLRCTKCSDYLLCKKCYDANLHYGHKAHMETFKLEIFNK